MEGTRAKRGEEAVYAAGYLMVLACTRKRAPVIDPGARLGESGGDNSLSCCLPLSCSPSLRRVV